MIVDALLVRSMNHYSWFASFAVPLGCKISNASHFFFNLGAIYSFHWLGGNYSPSIDVYHKGIMFLLFVRKPMLCLDEKYVHAHVTQD